MKHVLSPQFLQFCVAGGAGFLVQGGLLLAFTHTSFPYWLEWLAATGPGFLLKFLISKLWVFAPQRTYIHN